jgi:hypothetical protein
MNTNRIAPAAGAAGTALVFAGLMTANEAIHASRAADAPTVIATDFATNADGVRRGVWLALVGLTLLFPFLADLRRRIRAAEGENGLLAGVAYAGGIVGAAGLLGYLALLVAASTDAIGAHADAAATLRLLTWEYGGVLAPAYAALVGAASIAVIRHRLLHRFTRPLAWLGLPLAAGLAFSGFSGGALVVTSLLWLGLLAAAFALDPGRRPEPVPAAEAAFGGS